MGPGAVPLTPTPQRLRRPRLRPNCPVLGTPPLSRVSPPAGPGRSRSPGKRWAQQPPTTWVSPCRPSGLQRSSLKSWFTLQIQVFTHRLGDFPCKLGAYLLALGVTLGSFPKTWVLPRNPKSYLHKPGVPCFILSTRPLPSISPGLLPQTRTLLRPLPPASLRPDEDLPHHLPSTRARPSPLGTRGHLVSSPSSYPPVKMSTLRAPTPSHPLPPEVSGRDVSSSSHSTFEYPPSRTPPTVASNLL